MTPHKIHYELSHIRSQASVALFAPRPRTELDTRELLDLAKRRPMDSFLHAHAVRVLLKLPPEEILTLKEQYSGTREVLSLLLMAGLLKTDLGELLSAFSSAERWELATRSPLNYGRILLQEDHHAHQAMVRAFSRNLTEHVDPGVLVVPDLPGCLGRDSDTPVPAVPLSHIRQQAEERDPEPLPPKMQVFKEAMHRLYSIGAIFGQEMRHQASLSPWAIQRNWTLDVGTSIGANHYRLSGPQTSYGRGLDLEGARVSCAMEIVERFSSYATISDGVITGCVRRYPLIRSDFATLHGRGENPLDPGKLCLETPYAGESLYWMEGHTHEKGEEHVPAFIPVQCAFLFSNLDEPDLFSGLSSTGLASGTIMDQAKTNAIIEVIERDSKGTRLFDPSCCFRITTDDPVLKLLLKRYANLGIEVQFQDITGDLGIPCYRCYVIGQEGQIITGTAANLDGDKALVAAMTETPYPFPNGPESRRDPRDLPVRRVEDLPRFSTGSPTGDRILLETLLERNNLRAFYADLTSRRLGFPVVRAIIPGLEIMTDFDAFSRVSPRMYNHYLELIKKR
jgi:ribosomal protein S12 methylthiotransferase accessory factor YcaO